MPAFDRALAVDLALAILLKDNDVEWWFKTLRNITGFPSFREWSFLEPLLDYWLRQIRDKGCRIFRAHAGVWGAVLVRDFLARKTASGSS